jgi:hypothetical protein
MALVGSFSQLARQISLHNKPVGDISYRVSGKRVIRKDPAICYSVYPLHFTEHDKHEMQMDPEFVPTPSISERFSAYINIPVGLAME